ncbi:glycosyltransferase family 2 protein [Legionella yabuuchiae]|uniref:glycosyltransferase family 2 protein n=1 Tax=Legionella yabuuchiae TaxID=376727 RepID=UPI00105526F2|nr:glycosyltransferase family 2 protein [Legionella yabuuchiae]
MLSVIIIAKNEEENIRRCLESIRWADQIIVLDSGSTDNTVAIAKEYTNEVYQTDWKGYGVQKERALSHATGDWVLNLDADEAVDEDLKQELLVAIKSNQAEAYRIPIRMEFYGKTMHHSSSPKRHVRLFKREGAHYSLDIVHEKILLPDQFRISQLSSPIRHQSFRDVSHALYKINRYSSYTAKIRLEHKKSGSLIKTLTGSLWMFIRCYLLQRGFLDGREGLVLALLNAQGTLARGLKQLYPDKEIQYLPKVMGD